ncbi:MAG: matrixin family metalloprotease [Chloroflexota bacterium]
MKSTVRRLIALVGATTVLMFAAPPAGAATLHIEELRMGSTRAAVAALARASAAVGVAPGPCQDGAYNKLGGSWKNGSYSWSFQAYSTPGYLSKTAVRDVLRKSFSNITNAHNDCALADHVSATNNYLGTTSTRARCARRDMHNVVGFRALEAGVLAVTCYWISNGRIVEADVQINSRERWALSLGGCTDEVMLESTMTHEAGHVFGLDHVGERRHGRLTMSPYLDGPCENDEATLGKGDVLGLEALY